MPELFGRRRELADLKSAIARREARWITGPTGVGKTALCHAATLGLDVHVIDGAWMESFDDARQTLEEELECRATSRAAGPWRDWLVCALPRLGDGADVVIWQDFGRVHRPIAQLVLDAVRDARLTFTLVIESRDMWCTPAPFTKRFRHIELCRLGDDASRELCDALGCRLDDVPERLRGHPYLMSLYAATGATSEADGLLRELPAERAALAKRMCLAATPLQRQWAQSHAVASQLLGIATMSAEMLVFHPDELVAAMATTGERAELERELLDYLCDQPLLAADDLARALELCDAFAANDEALALIAAHAGQTTNTYRDALRPSVTRMIVDGRLDPVVRIQLSGAPADGAGIEQALRCHTLLAQSQVADERVLAELGLVRAAAASGLATLPPDLEQRARDLIAGTALPVRVRRELTWAWLARELYGERDPAREQWLLGRLCDVDVGPLHAYERARTAYATCVDGDHASGAAHFEAALAELDATRDGMACALLQPAMAHARYAAGGDCEVPAGARVATEAIAAHFLDAALRWQAGGAWTCLGSLSAGPVEADQYRHAALPGPYAVDYAAAACAAVGALVTDAPLGPRATALLIEAPGRALFDPVIAIGAVAAALHSLLRDDFATAHQLADALSGGPAPFARQGAALGRLCGLVVTGSAHELADQLTRSPVPDRITAAYCAVVITRAALRRGLDREPLYAALQSRRFARMRGRPETIVAHCRRRLALGALGAVSFRGDDIVSEQLVRAAEHDVTDPAVLDARRAIDEAWFEPLELAQIARRHRLSERTLAKRFRLAVGVSPKEYQRARRIAESSRFLLDTDWSSTTIAQECGYYDSAHFSREFKRMTGMPPSAFRSRWRVDRDRRGAPANTSARAS